MAKRNTKAKKADPPARKTACTCGSDCFGRDAHLPGYLLIAFGLLALPINFDLVPGLEWAKAWPLLLVLFGFVLLVKVALCRSKSG